MLCTGMDGASYAPDLYYTMSIFRSTRYFLQEHLHRKDVVHGGIGNIDAEKILLSKGYHPISFPCPDSFSLAAKLKRIWYLCRVFTGLPKGAVVVVQFPVYPRIHQLLVKMLSWRKQVTVICFIADIDGLKTGDGVLLQKEIETYRRFNYFIVHNTAMERWVRGFAPNSVVRQITFFDFLTQPVIKPRDHQGGVVFAGNLAKSGFLHRLDELKPPVQLALYGAGAGQLDHWPPYVHFKGIYDPYSLPQHLEGSYGLVWDGDSVDGCAGPLGAYMAYISHHKLSLYIVAGLPVITATKAASAELVQRYGIGFAVDSLHEMADLIGNTDAATYQTLVNNTREWAQRISKGDCLGAALDSIETAIVEKKL